MKIFTKFAFLLILACSFISCEKDQEEAPPKSSEKKLNVSTVDGIAAATITFDSTTSAYTIIVPFGTAVKDLKLGYALSTAATVAPDPAVARDYSNPVSYTVTAEDGTTQTFTVKVTQTAPPKSTEKQITGFSFAGLNPAVPGAINQSTRKIKAVVPAATDLKALVPTIELSPKASVSPKSGVVQNFTAPVNYTVTAEDGSTQSYEVSVEKAQAEQPAETACQVTRIENTTTKAFTTLEYNAKGSVTKSVYTDNAAGIVLTETGQYNAAGDLISWKKVGTLQKVTASQEEWTITYDGRKPTAVQFNNGSNNITFPVTVDGQGKVTQIGPDGLGYKLTYSGGNISKVEDFIENASVEATYDEKKQAFSSSKPSTPFSFIYYVGSSTYDVPRFFPQANNVVKITRFKNSAAAGQTTATYKYNKEGFPTEIEVTDLTNQTKKYTYQITYGNCQ